MADLGPFAGITRVEPFTGLVIDPPTWAAAHEYHDLHHRLHLLSLHGDGIATGLSVVPTDPPSDDVVIEPGVAIDAAGRAIVLAGRERLTVAMDSGTAHVAIEYVEASPASVDAAGVPVPEVNGSRGRIVEGYRLSISATEPLLPALELGRIAIAPGQSSPTIVAAANPWAPGENEIDGRHRRSLSTVAPKEIRVAFVADDQTTAGDHLQGFTNLVALGARSGVRIEPTVANGSGIPDADLLYVTGHADSEPSAKLLDALRERVRAGAWLVADGCGQGDRFVSGFAPLLQESGPANTEALVASAHHVFGATPEGACDGDVRWGPRALLSGRDYGCAWRGGRSDNPLPRGRIRDALEFGVNLAVSAGEYGRPR